MNMNKHVDVAQRIWYCPLFMNYKNEHVYTANEVAGILGISRRTVWEKCRTGQLPHLRYSKRCIRFREADIERFKQVCGRN